MKGFIQLSALLVALINKCYGEAIISSNLGYDRGFAEFWTCDTGVESFIYDYVPLELNVYSDYYDAICGYPPAIGSILLCSVELSYDKSDAYKEKIFKAAESSCTEYSSYAYSWTYYQEQYENATKNYVPLDEISNITLPLYVPTIPNITALLPEYRGYRAYYFDLDSGTWFSVGICGYFLLLIIISAIHNFFRETSISRAINGSKFSKLCQKYVIFSPLFPNGKYSQEYGWKYLSGLFPNRIQFITDVFLFALQVAFYCVSYRYKNTYWFGPAERSWKRFVADRTGVMAFGKIPLLILFAGRNNLLLFITGWSYSTFLHFHKVVACWMALDALIHSVAYTIDSLGYYVLYLHDTYFACGVAATVLCGFILLQALHPFRKFFYEYFLTIHVVVAIAFIIMCWYHCNILGWLEWLIAACCVWFFDRLVRVIRMSAFGWRTATLTVVDDQLMKIEVPKPAWWFHRPGTYAYIYFAGWIFWENHPFTTVIEGNNICAYIRVKRGVTYRMWNKLVANNNKMQWKVCVEGPYGGSGSSKLRKYEEALLVAGGSGAPSILENASKVTKGKLIWVTHSLQTVKAYQFLLANINIEIDLYVTRQEGSNKLCSVQDLFSGSESENLSTESSEKESDGGKDIEIKRGINNITINFGRPNLHELINSSIVGSSSKSIGIMACGPPVMMDEIRNTVTAEVTSWDKSVDFFDEFQTW